MCLLDTEWKFVWWINDKEWNEDTDSEWEDVLKSKVKSCVLLEKKIQGRHQFYLFD